MSKHKIKKVISVIGFIDMDMYMTTSRLPDPGECLAAQSYDQSPGGKGANAAVAAFRTSHVKTRGPHGTLRFESPPAPWADLDVEVRMVGAVGDDANGVEAIRNLEANGINTLGVRVLRNVLTGVCFCMIDAETGENRLLFTTGATGELTPDDFMTVDQLGSGVRPDLIISQLEVAIEAVERMLRTAHSAGIEVLLNAAPAREVLSETYECITHFIVNETEAAILAGLSVEDVKFDTWDEIAQEFLSYGVKNVVITLGAEGAYYANSKDRGHVPAEKVNVKDTTGAGDTFVGAYATEYLRQTASGERQDATNWNIKQAVERSNRASASTICKIGAQASVPWADEIDYFAADSTLGPSTRTMSEISDNLDIIADYEPRL